MAVFFKSQVPVSSASSYHHHKVCLFIFKLPVLPTAWMSCSGPHSSRLAFGIWCSTAEWISCPANVNKTCFVLKSWRFLESPASGQEKAYMLRVWDIILKPIFDGLDLTLKWLRLFAGRRDNAGSVWWFKFFSPTFLLPYPQLFSKSHIHFL